MRRVVLPLVVLFISFSAIAQLKPSDIPANPPQNPQVGVATPQTAGNTTLKKDDIPKDVKGGKPLDFEAGADAAVLKGKGVIFGAVKTTTSQNDRIRIGPTGFTSFDVNAQYNYTDRTKRIAEISLRPSLLTAWAGDPFGPIFAPAHSVTPYLDLRSRSLDRMKDTTGTATTNDSQKSFFYGGAGVEYRSTVTSWLRMISLTGADLEAPTLGVTYYKKISGDLPKDAPEGFDAVQARLTVDIPIPLTANLRGPDPKIRMQREKCFEDAAKLHLSGDCPSAGSFPFTFSVDLKASRPTVGTSRKTEHYADIALKMMQEDSKIGYAIRYRTGKDLGFDYDKKILASIVMRLFQ